MKLSGIVFLFIISLITTNGRSALAQKIQNPNDLDIVGLRLGMSRAEAEKNLKSHNPNFALAYYMENVINGKNDGPKFLTQIVARDGTLAKSSDGQRTYWSDIKEMIKLYFTGEPGKEIVTIIGRGVVFKEGERPAGINIINALKNKYGNAPTIFSGEYAQRYIAWYYNTKEFYETGEITKHHNNVMIEECLVDSGEFFDKRDNLIEISLSTAGTEDCGVKLTAQIHLGDPNFELSWGVGTMLSNPALLLRGQIARSEYSRHILDSSREQEIEAAKKRGQDTKF